MVIEFRVGAYGNTPLQLQIYDLAGRLVKSFSLTPNLLSPITVIEWDGKDDKRQDLSSGIYFVKLKTGEFSQIEAKRKSRFVGTNKLLLLR